LWSVLLTKYYTDIKTRRMRCEEHVARRGKRRGAYRVLVGRPEERKLGSPRRRWEDNIKMGLQEIGLGVDSIDLVRDRDRLRAAVNAVMNLRVP